MKLLEIKGLNITLKTPRLPLVYDMSFELSEGEILGIVGESGCGKSLTNHAIMGLLPPELEVEADILNFKEDSLLNLSPSQWQKHRGANISMIFQNPMSALNPCWTIEYQLKEAITAHFPKLSEEEKTQRCFELLEKVGITAIHHRLQSYPHQLSGGMCQRVMIAQALACRPKVLLADEPTTALDVTIQKQILDLLTELAKSEGLALVLVSHDLSLISRYCQRVLVMYAGTVIEEGQCQKLLNSPQHPYTKGLLNAHPDPFGPKKRPMAIPGRVPSPQEALSLKCKFSPRCFNKKPECEEQEISKTSSVKCLFPL